MSISAELALQEAIFSHLQQDANVQAVLGSPVRLYDDPPAEPIYPFASFGRHQSRDTDADTFALNEQTLSLHIWSRYRGKREAQQILEAVRGSLNDMPPAMNGHRLVSIRTVFADVLRARNGRIFQAILRLRALTQPIS
ncbi:MAG: DUF3168 domain-containing protein [Robiginitomaculum sp.]|nr:DUF3168 domain-containing protein [Robiginitomaculum sp.]